jgi:hypothetical protein
MNSITIDAEVSPDRRLIYTLPPEVPVGPVKLVILAVEEQPLTREEARQRLLVAGKLVTTLIAPNDAVALSDDERQRLAHLFGGGPETTLYLINHERGPKT